MKLQRGITDAQKRVRPNMKTKKTIKILLLTSAIGAFLNTAVFASQAPIQSIAQFINQKMSATDGVLVMDFQDFNGGESANGNYYAEELRIELANISKASIIDRKALDQLLGEKKLSDLGFIDSKNLLEIGKLCGAQKAVYGTINEKGKKLILQVKLVSLEKGVLLAGVKKELKRVFKGYENLNPADSWNRVLLSLKKSSEDEFEPFSGQNGSSPVLASGFEGFVGESGESLYPEQSFEPFSGELVANPSTSVESSGVIENDAWGQLLPSPQRRVVEMTEPSKMEGAVMERIRLAHHQTLVQLPLPEKK